MLLITLVFLDDEDVQLSAEERCFYVERFDEAVISFSQLEMAETIGEGINVAIYVYWF